MQGSGRRRGITRTGVAAGSVWESRMRMDEVRGGIKVFNGEESCIDDGANGDEDGLLANQKLTRNQSDVIVSERRKRKSWRPPEPRGINAPMERSPIQLRKSKSESSNSLRISNVSSPGIGRSKIVFRELGNDTEIGEKGALVIGDGCEDGGGDEVELEENEIETEEEIKSFDDKEIVLPAEKPKDVEEEKGLNEINEIPMIPDAEKTPPSVVHHQKKDQNPINPPPPIEVDEEMFESTLGEQNRMQNIVDLVLWKDISKSAFVFGLGTFILLSSSYTKDLNLSPISAISYLGLVYLAVIFLYKSVIHRGSDEFDERDERQVLGEEEAIWIVRLILPYVNELLLKLRALFSGDPATTMKLAAMLFVLARCGSSITIWTLAKLVFFGVFTVPKVCSSYKVQLVRYGTFWLERFRDGWESCSHKKAVAAAAFTLMWNISSTIARVWAVFMLVVAVRLYQQQRMEGWSGEEETVTVTVTVEDRREAAEVRQEAEPVWHRRRRGGPAVRKGVREEIKLKKWT